MLKRLFIALVFTPLLFLFACQSSGDKHNNQTNVSEDKDKSTISLRLDRFELDLFALPVDSINLALPKLQQKYGEFFDIFTNRIINIGSYKKPDFSTHLKSFITDRYMYTTYDMVKKEYPSLDDQKIQLEVAFQKYHEIFPKKVIPHIYSLISGFNQSIITSDTILGISLDKYLGRTCEFYVNLELNQYQRRTMEKSYLVTDAMRGWCYSEFLYDDSAENLLTNILYQGKIIYLMKELFPETSDTIIFGYTNKQLNWCKSNVNPMWTFLIEHKLLFSTDYMTINKLTNPAPFTTLFTTESPGKAVNWLGYQIIKSYMKSNNVSFEALLKNKDFQSILEQSKFQP
jgi:hypothetical protein